MASRLIRAGFLGVFVHRKRTLLVFRRIELIFLGLNLCVLRIGVQLDDGTRQRIALFLLRIVAVDTRIGLSALLASQLLRLKRKKLFKTAVVGYFQRQRRIRRGWSLFMKKRQQFWVFARVFWYENFLPWIRNLRISRRKTISFLTKRFSDVCSERKKQRGTALRSLSPLWVRMKKHFQKRSRSRKKYLQKRNRKRKKWGKGLQKISPVNFFIPTWFFKENDFFQKNFFSLSDPLSCASLNLFRDTPWSVSYQKIVETLEQSIWIGEMYHKLVHVEAWCQLNQVSRHLFRVAGGRLSVPLLGLFGDYLTLRHSLIDYYVHVMDTSLESWRKILQEIVLMEHISSHEGLWGAPCGDWTYREYLWVQESRRFQERVRRWENHLALYRRWETSPWVGWRVWWSRSQGRAQGLPASTISHISPSAFRWIMEGIRGNAIPGRRLSLDQLSEYSHYRINHFRGIRNSVVYPAHRKLNIFVRELSAQVLTDSDKRSIVYLCYNPDFVKRKGIFEFRFSHGYPFPDPILLLEQGFSRNSKEFLLATLLSERKSWVTHFHSIGSVNTLGEAQVFSKTFSTGGINFGVRKSLFKTLVLREHGDTYLLAHWARDLESLMKLF